LYAVETGEVAVEAENGGAVFDGERGKVRIARQVAGGAGRPEQSPQDLGVPLGGIDDLRTASAR
jgi:hypothetical protein